MTVPEPEERAAVMLEGLANIAAQMGFDRARLIEDLIGDSELGKFCRALLDLQSTALPLRKRGKPSNDVENLYLVATIERSRREGKTWGEAAEDYLDRVRKERDEEENTPESRRDEGPDQDSIIRQYRRLRKRWSTRQPDVTLADLFRDRPKRS
ncbi:hypothetical protein [Shinella sp.]|uniref:hypothetical protein n=1 Tax=Shinella sp. TaxID=1870904 RepID=UPI003F6FC97E